MAQHFKVQLALKRLPGDDLVHFKVDGGRFLSDKTIKLNVDAKYGVELTFRPRQRLQSVIIEGSRVEANEESAKDDSYNVYRTTWVTTGSHQQKKGSRQQIPIVLELEGLGSMKMTIQCKFYPEKETDHCRWGSPVNYIEYECKVPEGATYIDVVKETFR